jgi:predicted O-linked N-acetylglucosamine transferase (SPINDLY family)
VIENPERILAAAEKLYRLGETRQAESMIRDLIWALPDHAEAHHRYARLLREEQRFGEAERAYRAAIDCDPKGVTAAIELIDLMRASGRHEEAFALAAKLEPGEITAEAALALQELWSDAADFLKADEAGDPLDLAEQLPEGQRGRAFVLPSLLAAADTPERVKRLNACIRDWARARSIDASILPVTHAPRAASERIRLCFIGTAGPPSGGARAARIARHLDRDRFRVELFVHGAAERDARERFEELGAAFDKITVMPETSARAIAEALAARGFDAVIDLDGHGRVGARISALAYKPAPVQLAWPERPVPVGLSPVNATLADPVVAAVAKGGAIEPLLPLDGGWLALEPLPEIEIEPEVASARASFPVFATMAEPDWLRPLVIETWAAILQELPPARLIFLGPAYSVPTVRQNLNAAFEACGIGQRIDFAHAEAAGVPELALWNVVDLCLDPFPLSLGERLAEPLHMGVPAVSWAGMAPWQRTGASLLTAAGLSDLCVRSRDAYVDKAVELIWDVARRRELRRNLRARFAAAPHFDAQRIAASLAEHLTALHTPA